MQRVMAFLALAGAVTFTSAAETIVKETFPSAGASRTYYLFVPDRARDKAAPLVVLLHGSTRDGKSLIPYWERLAKKEGIILAGLDATVRDGWGMHEDGPHGRNPCRSSCAGSSHTRPRPSSCRQSGWPRPARI